MQIPRFMRFYGYSLEDCLQEKAKTFFALVNYMFRLEALEMLNQTAVISIPHATDNYRDSTIKSLKQQAEGISGIVKQVRTAKNVNKRR